MNISINGINPNDPIFAYRFLSMKEVCALTGYSRTHIYRLERAGQFVRRRKLGPGKIGFLAREVIDWINSRTSPDLPDHGDDLISHAPDQRAGASHDRERDAAGRRGPSPAQSRSRAPPGDRGSCREHSHVEHPH